MILIFTYFLFVRRLFMFIDSSKILTSQFETSFEDFINKYNGERLNEETT